MKKIIYLCIVCLLIHCHRNPYNLFINENDSKYPTKLYPLSEVELIELQSEFNNVKGQNIKAELDDYGLIDYAGTLNRGNSNIEDANTAISKSKDILVKLQKFTNVYDSLELEIDEATNEHGINLFNDWIVTYKNQNYRGLEVIDTPIMVLLGNEVKQVLGHHYKDIYIPEKDPYDIQSAKEILIGYEINYLCWSPQTFLIYEENIFTEKTEKVIYPREIEDCIEFRVAWKIPIGENINHPSWYIYIDVISGEILYIDQIFIC